MEKKILPFLILIALLQCFVPVVQSFCSVEIDATSIVSRVIDGDTFDTTSEGRVRLADVDTPERGESGYYDAKDFLIKLVYDKTVYLDIDDIYRTDKYGRLVCVVYVEHNATHFKNVNKALLVRGYAVVWNFRNEFNPNTWSLYCPKEESPEFPSSDTQPEPFPSMSEWLLIIGITVIMVVVIADTYAFIDYRKRKASVTPSSTPTK